MRPRYTIGLPPSGPAHAIAGAVVDLVLARRPHERLGGALGVAPVAQRQLRAGHQQLAGLAGRHLVQLVVGHQHLHARVGIADRHQPQLAVGQRLHRVVAVQRAGDGQLGRAVQVLDLAVRGGGGEGAGHLDGQPLAAEQAPANAGKRPRLQHPQLVHQHRGRRHREPDGELVLLGPLARQHLLVRGRHAQAGARLPADEQVEHAQVEGQIEGLAEAIVLGRRRNVPPWRP